MASTMTTKPVGAPACGTVPSADRGAPARRVRSFADLATPPLPSPRGTRAIASVPTAGVVIAAPGTGGAVGPAPAPGAASELDPILALVSLIAANQDRIARLADLAADTGSMLGSIGKRTLGVAREGAGAVERLWSGSWLGKLAAVITALGTGLLFASGGILAAAGWLMETVSGAFLGAFADGGEEPTPPPPSEARAELERRNGQLWAELVARLERLASESPADQRALLNEAAARLGLEEARELSREERARAAVFVESWAAAGLQPSSRP